MSYRVATADETGGGDDPVGAPHTRRLSDQILIAFHHACDQADLEVAGGLLRLLERLVERKPPQPDANRRRNVESLVAAHERLWQLRRPEPAR